MDFDLDVAPLGYPDWNIEKRSRYINFIDF